MTHVDERKTMSNNQSQAVEVSLVVQIIHVVGRLGLSMVGAMCGTFVAAQLTMTNAALFDSVASMSHISALRWQSLSSNAQKMIRSNCFPRSAHLSRPSPR
jgi:hypothetical protein